MSLNLITDRTAADAAFAAAHRDSPTPLKGAYNAADYNRVGEALNYLSDWLFTLGYGWPLSLRTDWDETENFTPADGAHYLSTVAQLREYFFTMPSTPPLPDNIHQLFESAGFTQANAIEQLLVDVERLIGYMIASFHRANEFYSGEPVQIAGVRYAKRLTWGEIMQMHTWAELQGFTWNEIMYGMPRKDD